MPSELITGSHPVSRRPPGSRLECCCARVGVNMLASVADGVIMRWRWHDPATEGLETR